MCSFRIIRSVILNRKNMVWIQSEKIGYQKFWIRTDPVSDYWKNGIFKGKFGKISLGLEHQILRIFGLETGYFQICWIEYPKNSHSSDIFGYLKMQNPDTYPRCRILIIRKLKKSEWISDLPDRIRSANS